MKITNIDIPQSDTKLTLNIAGKKASEVKTDLKLIASVIDALQSGAGYYIIDEHGDYIVRCRGEYEFPRISISHREWDTDDEEIEFDTNAIIISITWADGMSYIAVNKKYAERIINDEELYIKQCQGKVEGFCDVCMEKRCEGGEIY